MTCPGCGALCCMHIFVLYESFHLFFIPIFKWGRHYFAKASCCGSVFELDEAEGRAFERKEKSCIDPACLHKASRSSGICPACGTWVPPGAHFCMNCGNPI